LVSWMRSRLITQRRRVVGFIPPRIKDWLKHALRDLRLRYCLQKLQAFRNTTPPRDLVVQLREAWGNLGFTADTDYLLEAVRLAQQKRGPILECGSGVSTILFASLGIELTSLEHDSAWAATCRQFAVDHGLRTNVVHAPLVSYGDFDWYETPSDLPSPNLILCDGPPASTRGGRYGLLPVLNDRLSRDCLILMDDGERPEDFRTAQQWASDFQLSMNSTTSKSGTTITLQRPRYVSDPRY